MDRATAVRFMALYVPAMAAGLLALGRPRIPRLFAAGLVGFGWTLPSLLALQLANLRFGWWQFHAEGGLWRGMPVDLLLGWCVLWGAIPILTFRRAPVAIAAAAFLGLDLVLMPACRPVVALSDRWLVGELVALGGVLIPALLFARWTLEDRRLAGRAVLHVLMAGGVVLFAIPEMVFALRPGCGWESLFFLPAAAVQIGAQVAALLGVPGVSAVQEFARRGGGTPIPYDPPKRLVTSGFYRYLANPMQVSCTLTMAAWSAMLRNPWLAIGAGMSLVYSLGLANWDEGEDLGTRFGDRWRRYRKHVRPWRLRWSPWHDPALPMARLYIAETCGLCSEVRRWFDARRAVGLEIVAAERHPSGDLRRITYDPMDGTGTEEGVCAFARGVEHIHLGWAFAGACLRLPGVSHFVQLVLDVSGLGPRSLSP